MSSPLLHPAKILTTAFSCNSQVPQANTTSCEKNCLLFYFGLYHLVHPTECLLALMGQRALSNSIGQENRQRKMWKVWEQKVYQMEREEMHILHQVFSSLASMLGLVRFICSYPGLLWLSHFIMLSRYCVVLLTGEGDKFAKTYETFVTFALANTRDTLRFVHVYSDRQQDFVDTFLMDDERYQGKSAVSVIFFLFLHLLFSLSKLYSFTPQLQKAFWGCGKKNHYSFFLAVWDHVGRIMPLSAFLNWMLACR